MSGFNVGDKVKRKDGEAFYDDSLELTISDIDGNTVRFKEDYLYGNVEELVLVEDRSNWHMYYDAILAWAKGADLEFREKDSDCKDPEWRPCEDGFTPHFDNEELEFRVKPPLESLKMESLKELEAQVKETSKFLSEISAQLDKITAHVEKGGLHNE